MKTRIGSSNIFSIIGVVIPFLIIVIVALLSILDIGITIRESYPTSIAKNELVEVVDPNEPRGMNGTGPVIKTIEVSNDFIFQRKISTNYLVCRDVGDNRYGGNIYFEVLVDDQVKPTRNYVEIDPGKTAVITIRLQKTWEDDSQSPISKIYLYEGASHAYYGGSCYNVEKNYIL